METEPWMECTHVLHGCLGCRWTPARRGGVPLRCAQCCRCGWCRDTRSAPQTGLPPCLRSGDAGILSPLSGAPSVPARGQRAGNGRAPAASSGWPAQERRLRGTFRCMYVCLFTHHTFCFTPCLIPSFLCTASSHIQSSHRGASKDGPLLLLCLPLLLQQLLCSPSPNPFGSLWRTCYLLSWHSAYTLSSSALQPPRPSAHQSGISFSIPWLFVSFVKLPFPEKEVLFPRHCSLQPLQPPVIHSLALKSTHRLWVSLSLSFYYVCVPALPNEPMWELFCNLRTASPCSVSSNTHIHTGIMPACLS